jgi:predicted DNA-binding protein
MPYNFIGMPRETLLQIRMSTQERKELKALADSKGLTESAMARQAIKEAIEQQKLKRIPR